MGNRLPPDLGKLLTHPVSLLAEAIFVVMCILVLAQFGASTNNPQAQETAQQGMDAISLLVTHGPPAVLVIGGIVLTWCLYTAWMGYSPPV